MTRGLCHGCYASNVDTQWHRKLAKPLCGDCWLKVGAK